MEMSTSHNYCTFLLMGSTVLQQGTTGVHMTDSPVEKIEVISALNKEYIHKDENSHVTAQGH